MKKDIVTLNKLDSQCLGLTDEIIIPNGWDEPEWFKKLKQKIINDIKNAKNSEDANKIFAKYLENDILEGKIKPDYPLNKKNIKKLINKMWEAFDDESFKWKYTLIGYLGFILSTYKPANFSPETLILPDEFIERKKELLKKYEEKIKNGVSKNEAVMWIDNEFKKLTNDVLNYWEKKGIDLPDIVKSGSRGSPDDIRKMLVAVGLSINSKGEINDIILNPQVEGLEQTQIFHYSSQAIQALYAKSTETAKPGYLARKLSTICEPVVLSKIKDCGSKKYFNVDVLDESILEAIDGRITDSGHQIDASKDKHLIGKKVKLRSPLYCKAEDGICETCYNPKYIKKLSLKPGAKLGLLFSTVVGSDILVNLTLKKSHVGVGLNLKEVNLEKDIFKYAE
jgi:DNA-directed RNA polymerase subunit beta'